MTTKPKVVPLNKDHHAKIKINNNDAFAHISKEHMLPVVVHEFVVAGAEFPVVFIKNQEQLQPVALLGLNAQQNLFIQDQKWLAHYVPRAVRNYPLVLVKDTSAEGERLMVAVDEASSRVSQTEGNALFNDDGSESEFLTFRKQQMAEYLDMGAVTHNFIQKLQSLDLIKEQVLNLTVKGEERRITGIYLVDEAKLNELSDEQFLELRKSGYLTAIYAQLMSLQHTQKLVKKIADAG